MDTHRDVCIVLKKSLKWMPVIGWVLYFPYLWSRVPRLWPLQGMQFFNFIFLARSWASDRLYLVKQLALLGRRAQERDTPLTFILYPEGTLVSRDTRPISKKYAEKLGIVSLSPVLSFAHQLNISQSDLTHTLLPRSTGLHHSLRALSPCVPSLQLLDITVAYPGTLCTFHWIR
jgi:1-acyl-sn-glycerol-3-phosphate acyltransferase